MNSSGYDAFQVRGEPWSFIIDSRKTVVRVFPDRTLYQEIDPVLASLTGKKPTRLFK